MIKTTTDLEQILKYNFKDKSILHKALTHKSYNTNKNNEKLEFLGDRVLGLIISKKLLEKYPSEKEGVIDKKFANLVNKRTCIIISALLLLNFDCEEALPEVRSDTKKSLSSTLYVASNL